MSAAPGAVLSVDGVVAGYGAAEADPQGRVAAGSRQARSSRSSVRTGPASRRCSRPSPGWSRRAKGQISLNGADVTGCECARPGAGRHRLRAAGAQRLWRDDGRREPGDQRFPGARQGQDAQRGDVCSAIRCWRRSGGAGAHAVGRTAPDPGHGDGADERARAAAARRADSRALAQGGRRTVRRDRRAQPGGACRS